ncbi:mechanosensitive ion channel family protein [Candidatus Uabimicrobium sp. HlEnr_7]|uniref:mechanosensitive ion channel family protein n=1 Tax=Candidatus Uabimicrobium helgolandensis TaxID=3095367 RepID=UPI0035585CAE
MYIFWLTYFSVIGLIGIVVIFRLRKFIDGLEIYRKKALRKVIDFSAVPTDSPMDLDKWSQDAGVKSIETRFSMIRRILAPFVFFFWFFLLFVPLFPTIPAVFASILAAFITGLIAIITRPIIENAIAGIVISFSQPIRIGDTVKIDGHYGTIEEITITHTKLKVWNWQRYIIPNRILLEKEYLNYSIVDEFIWTYVEFWVAYNVDIDLVKSVAISCAQQSQYLLNCEEPAFWVMGLEQKSICCWVAGWADTPGNAWELQANIRQSLIKGFQQHGIFTHLQNIRLQKEKEQQ